MPKHMFQFQFFDLLLEDIPKSLKSQITVIPKHIGYNNKISYFPLRQNRKLKTSKHLRPPKP